MTKPIPILVVVFLGFWMFTDPSGLADSAGAVGGQVTDWAGQLFGALIDFIKSFG